LNKTGVALGSTGSLHVWADTDVRLSGVSLDLLETGGAIKFTSLDVPNPSNRWSFTDGPVTISDSQVTRVGGGAIPNLSGSGIGPASGIASPVLIGSIGYEAQANGTSQLFLRVGGNVISDWIGQSPDVHFGTAAAAAVPGGVPGGMGPVGSIIVELGEGFMGTNDGAPTDGDSGILSAPPTMSDSSIDTDISDAADYSHTVSPRPLEILPFVPPPKPPYVSRSRPALSPAAGDALSRYGNGAARPGGTLSPATAPEPSSLMLLAVGSLFVWQIRLLRREV
jgi:hypothetical protein